MDAGDIETLGAGELAEGVHLTGREACPIADYWHRISHIVEEDCLESRHLKFYVEQSIVDGGTDATAA